MSGTFARANRGAARLAHSTLARKISQLEEAKANQAFQLELSDRIRQFSDPDEVSAIACALLGRTLGVSRVLYAEVHAEDGTAYVRHDWTAGDCPSLAGQHKIMDDFSPHIINALRAGATVVNHDVASDPRTAAHVLAYQHIGIRADLIIPYVRAGVLTVVLTLQSAQPRQWQPHELRLAQETAERTWSAVEAAQAQAALRYERDRSQSIFDSMAEGFAVLDRHWTILQVNAEGLRLTRRTAAEVIGRNHWEVWPELKDTAAELVYHRVMQTGITEIIELLYTWPDQQQAWMEVRAQRSFDGGVAFFFRDVSERRAAQEQLALADRRKDEFLAMLAHELRNPLAPIGAAADLLQVALLDEALIRQTSQIIARQVRHMTSLVDDLLDVSRVTSGLVELNMERLDIAQVVAEAVEQLSPLMRARRHRLTVSSTEQAALVLGDRHRLVQVLANLLNNAAKYTFESGHIAVTTEVGDDHVLIHVSDDGIGMAADLAAHAFDLFTQAERSSDRSLGGLGLGLALVKSIVGLHHGSVSCSSAGAACGSIFTVCLPRVAAQQRGADVIPIGSASEVAKTALRILVVDDNVDAAVMLAMLLEAVGHEVTVTHHARGALEHISTATSDVFLLDIGLPGMDGNELARRLRAHGASAGAVLIAITGYGQTQDRAQTAAAGFDYHFVKPVDLEQLYAILAAIKRAETVA
ncbi:ATP-binding protein [Massilia sp. PWRC2]|uniref:hybrid sensor histidine kinase/response regulator n=1 Tax=Massilia sp. PWRC2 TaxID=2804626 RepID=UPI003CE84E1C